GSVGVGTLTHIQAETFKRAAGVEMEHVPYQGSAPAEADLIGGRIQLMFDSYPSASPHIRSGKITALAVATLEPSAVAPGLPTIDASGVPGFELAPWLGLAAPAGTPPAAVSRIADEVRNALQRPELRRRFLELGLEP